MGEKPQEAPFPVGTRLKRLRPDGSKAGTNEQWFDRDGVLATVIEVNGRPHTYRDSEFGDVAVHAWNTVQFDEDENKEFLRALDVDGLDGWEVLSA
jgi:hypothetical protein